MKIRGFFALLWAGLLAAVAAFAGQPVAELYDKAEYRIAMRDSVALYTAVYTPKAPGEAPVIIFRTPYGCGPYGAGRFPQGFEKGYLRSYVDRGYIIVMQDVRGRYMSEGDFEHVRPADSDETDETTHPRLLVYLEHAIRDGRVVRSGEPRVVSQRMQFIHLREDGTAGDGGPAPYLDCRPITAEERARVEHAVTAHCGQIVGIQQGSIGIPRFTVESDHHRHGLRA